MIRFLQADPFNLSLSEIMQMTVPMIRNLFKYHDREPREEETDPTQFAKILGVQPTIVAGDD